jgi:hypothetical protein
MPPLARRVPRLPTMVQVSAGEKRLEPLNAKLASPVGKVMMVEATSGGATGCSGALATRA